MITYHLKRSEMTDKGPHVLADCDRALSNNYCQLIHGRIAAKEIKGRQHPANVVVGQFLNFVIDGVPLVTYVVLEGVDIGGWCATISIRSPEYPGLV
jgi:hypothetical protein